MKLKNSVTIKQTITPATIQLLEMVQLNTVELGRYLTEQAMENPAIDIDELSAASKGGELASRVEWLGSFDPQRTESSNADDDDARNHAKDAPQGDFLAEKIHVQNALPILIRILYSTIP